MSDQHRPQQGPSLEDEGIPDHEGPLPAKERTGDAQEGLAPPGDTPIAAENHGVTDREQRDGESLDEKLAREAPNAETTGGGATRPATGRLVTPEAGAGAPDVTPEEIAEEADHRALSAEEEAVHRRDAG